MGRSVRGARGGWSGVGRGAPGPLGGARGGPSRRRALKCGAGSRIRARSARRLVRGRRKQTRACVAVAGPDALRARSQCWSQRGLRAAEDGAGMMAGQGFAARIQKGQSMGEECRESRVVGQSWRATDVDGVEPSHWRHGCHFAPAGRGAEARRQTGRRPVRKESCHLRRELA